MINLTSTAPTHSAPNTAAASFPRDVEYNANVPCDLIKPDPENRKEFDKDALANLAAQIKAEGLLQAIVLQRMPDGLYQIIAGERRWRAHGLLKMPTIAARIYSKESALSAVTKQTIENLGREDLNPIEEARQYRRLADLKMTQADIGKLVGGKSQPVIANTMKLLDLPKEVQDMIIADKLSAAHGVNLARYAIWPRVCIRIAKMAYDHGYTAKSLLEEGMPFSGQLENDGLIERIQLKEQYYSDGVIYDLPRHFKSHRDFIVGEHKAYYIVPESSKDNVWAPEKAKQDAARAVEATAAAARESKAAAKNGGKSKEQTERAKVKEKNKATRLENTKSLQLAIEKLKRTPEPTSLLVAIIVESAISGGFGPLRITRAAEAVGVILPKGLVSEQGGFGMRDVKLMRTMEAAELTRVAVAVLLEKEIDDANKNAWGMPANVERVMNSAVPALSVGDTISWTGNVGNGAGRCRGVIISEDEYQKATNSKHRCTPGYLPVRVLNPGPGVLPFNGVQISGMQIVARAYTDAAAKLFPLPSKAAKPAPKARRATKGKK